MRSRVDSSLVATLMLCSCVSAPPDAGFEDVAAEVAKRLGKDVVWVQDSEQDDAVAERVRAMLRHDLSIDDAVQIALLHNRSLRAVYEDLGVAQADLVDAGLLRNPALFAQARFPSRSPKGTNLEFDVVQQFLSVLLLPARTRLASTQFEAAKLRVTHEVLHVATEVRSGYYTLQGALQLQVVITEIARAAEASRDFAAKLHEAGNLSELEFTRAQALREQARVELTRVQADVVEAREELNRLLGLWGEQTGWTVSGRLPDLPRQDPELGDLESRAISQRQDLGALGRDVQILEQALGVTRDWRLIPFLAVGVNAERDADGTWLTGPNIELELPLFDRRQGEIRRLESGLRRAHAELYALAVDIRAEVRSLRDRMLLTRRLAEHFGTVIVPLRQRIVLLSQQQYNFMLIGTFELLGAKRDEIEAYRAYVEAVRDYWKLWAELERAIGGPVGPDSSPDSSPAPERPQHQHGGQ